MLGMFFDNLVDFQLLSSIIIIWFWNFVFTLSRLFHRPVYDTACTLACILRRTQCTTLSGFDILSLLHSRAMTFSCHDIFMLHDIFMRNCDILMVWHAQSTTFSCYDIFMLWHSHAMTLSNYDIVMLWHSRAMTVMLWHSHAMTSSILMLWHCSYYDTLNLWHCSY